jgi:hypothetical protein
MGPLPSQPGSIRPRTPTIGEVDRQLSSIGDVDIVVLVEGASDREALATLAWRRNVDLDTHSVAIVTMGGITNIGRFIEALGPGGRGLRVAGLCDAGERAVVARALSRSGLDAAAIDTLESFGFFACDRDLEDELIRSLGVDAVQAVLAAAKELTSFRRFQRQPAQRDVPTSDQLRRFLGTRSTRKIRLASELTTALPVDSAPPPLQRLLDHVVTLG